MKILKQGLLLVITFFVFLGLTACSLEREETYEKKTIGELVDYSDHIKNLKKEGFKRIK